LNTIIETEEKERRRFAQDLHDGMGPLLSTIKLYTRSVLTAKDDQNKNIAIEKALETIDEAIAHTKEIAYNISPSILKDFGLVVAVKSYVNKFNDTKKVNIHFQSDLNKRVPSNIEASLFRIIIELINNTVKHAHANNAFIEIKLKENNLLVQYSDDGIGFELQPVFEKSKGQGLVNIINRTKSIGGEINFETDINQGFNVGISIHVNHQK
jgi:signal transduction histidine kinase